MGQRTEIGVIGLEPPYQSTDQALSCILKKTGGTVLIGVPVFHQVFQQDPGHLVDTLLIGQVTGGNGIHPMVDRPKGDNTEGHLLIFPKGTGHFRDLKILVIMDDPGKPLLFKMFQEPIDDTFGLPAPCGGHHGYAPPNVSQDQGPALDL